MPETRIYLVDDCTPETIGVFSTFALAQEFAKPRQRGAERIRFGRLNSPDFARVVLEYNQFTEKWEAPNA